MLFKPTFSKMDKVEKDLFLLGNLKRLKKVQYERLTISKINLTSLINNFEFYFLKDITDNIDYELSNILNCFDFIKNVLINI